MPGDSLGRKRRRKTTKIEEEGVAACGNDVSIDSDFESIFL